MSFSGIPTAGVPPPGLELIEWIRNKIGKPPSDQPARSLWGVSIALACYASGFLPLLLKRPGTRFFWQMLHLTVAVCVLPGAAAMVVSLASWPRP
jgi:hypothetical protein